MELLVAIATRLSSYLNLAKPGIVLGNALSMVGGYFLGWRGIFEPLEFLGALGGISLVVASAGAVNNVIDRDIDKLMARTRTRPTANGDLGLVEALLVAGALGLAGFAILAWTTNLHALLAAAIGFAVYVGPYTLWLKRRSVHGTLVGSVSGAMPPLVGYAASSGVFDPTALLLVLTFGFWQMPHSWAIGIFRADDYRVAGIPLLPVLRGVPAAKRAMFAYTLAFSVSACALAWIGPAGWIFKAVAVSCAAGWLFVVAGGFRARDDVRWAWTTFYASLVVVMGLSLSLTIDGLLR